MQRARVLEQGFGTGACGVRTRKPRRGLAVPAGTAVQRTGGERRVGALLQRQCFFERTKRVVVTKRHLAGVAQKHPRVGVIGKPDGRGARGLHRAPAVVARPPQMDERRVRLPERGRPGGAHRKPPIGAAGGIALARRRPPHREARNARAPTAAHCLIMRNQPSKLQHRMTSAPAPLAGRRIVVTRARAQASDLVQRLTALGADVVCAPVIRIEPWPDLAPLRRALAALHTYEWVVFASANAVEIACEQPEGFNAVRVAAIGPATAAALRERGIAVTLIPERHVAESLAAALVQQGVSGKRILVPSAERARPVLADALRVAGAQVDVITAYRTVAEEGDTTSLGQDILAGEIDAVTFMSSSTVEHFVGLVGAAATSGRFTAAVIGPATAATARELSVGTGGLIEADPSTSEGLTAALVRHFASA